MLSPSRTILAALVCATSSHSYSAVDSSFGENGWLALPSTGQFVGLAEVPTANGAFLAIETESGGFQFDIKRYETPRGTMTVHAFNADGSRRDNFGNSGTLSLPSSITDFLKVGRGQGGSLIVVGRTGASAFDNDGAFDPAFGHDGRITFPSPIDAAAIRQGAIYTARIVTDADSTRLIVTRYRMADGSVDTSFGESGTSSIRHFLNARFGAQDMGLDTQNRIVVIGHTLSDGDSDIVAARFLRNGEPDMSFGPNGNAIALYDDIRNRARGLTFDGDIPIGYGGSGRALFQLLNDGRSFEPKGVADIGECKPASMTPLNNGGFLLFGTDDFSPSIDFCLLAFDKDLEVDRSYSNLSSTGADRARFDDFGADEGAITGLLLSSGRILLAGGSRTGGKLLMLTGPAPNYAAATPAPDNPGSSPSPVPTTPPASTTDGGSGSGL